MFSLEGVALLFVRRDTGKEFGPFPTEKIKTLVKQGKMKGSEHVSQDRVVWHLIKDVKEFADILNIAVSNSGAPQDTHESSDLPGLKVSGRSELPGHKASGGSELPGLKVSGGSELPGLKVSGGSELPGLKVSGESELPGLKISGYPDLPGVRNDLPGVRNDLPGVRNDLPGVRNDLPGHHNNLPESRGSSDLPGHHNNLPESRGSSDLPGHHNNLPESRGSSDLPGHHNNLPGSSHVADLDYTEPKESASSDVVFELDLGGDSLLGGDNQAPVAHALELSQEDEPALSMSSFSEQVTVPLATMDPDTSLQDEMDDLPSFIHAVEKDKALSYEEEEEPSKGNRTLIFLVLGVMILAGFAGAEYFLNIIGLFGKKSSETTKNVPVTPVKTPRKTVKIPVKKPRTKPGSVAPVFFISHEKLMEKTRIKKRDIACQAALALLYHHHDPKELPRCKYLVAKIPQAEPNDLLAVNNVLRLFILGGNYNETHLKRIWSGPSIKDPLKQARAIISRSLSQKRKSSLWNLMAGLDAFNSGKYPKAKTHLEMAKSLEADQFALLNYLLSLLGDKESITLLKSTAPDFYLLAQSGRPFYLADGLFLPTLSGHVPLAEKSITAKSSFGPRYRARGLALAAYSQWFKGDFGGAFGLCDKAAILDKDDAFTGKLCTHLWIFHGLYGKIGQFYMRVKHPWIKSALMLFQFAEGKTAKGVALWLDLKSANDPLHVLMAPFKSSFSQENQEFLLASLEKAYKLSPTQTAGVLLALVRLRNMNPDQFLAMVQKWNQKPNAATGMLLKYLTIISDFKNEKFSAVEKKVAALNVSAKGAYLPMAALRAIALNKIGKKEEANKDLSLFTDWESTASGLTARVFLAMDTPEMEKVYPIVEKNDVYLRDPYFYAVVSRSYLMGNRKDRLLRAKFYIDKILRLTPESFDSKILMGRVLIESGKFEQGERIMKENMESKEASGDDLFAWVDLEISLRRFGPAMDALEIGAKRFPKDTRIPFTRAEIYLGRNDPRKALEYLSKIKKIKGVEGKYHLLEGRCYLKLRESKRAEKAFSLAVKADPNSAHSHFLYGEILIKNNRVGRSVKYLEKAIILEMKARSTIKDYQKSDWLSRAHYLLGGVFKELGQRKKAALHFQKFAQMVPEGPLKDEAMRLLRSINAD